MKTINETYIISSLKNHAVESKPAFPECLTI